MPRFSIWRLQWKFGGSEGRPTPRSTALTLYSLWMAKRRGKPSSGEKSKRQRTAAERRLVSATLPWRSPPASPSFNNNDAAPSLQRVMAVGAERALPAVSRRASRIASGSEQDELNENDNRPQRLIFAYVRIVVVGDLDLKDQEVRSGAEHCLG